MRFLGHISFSLLLLSSTVFATLSLPGSNSHVSCASFRRSCKSTQCCGKLQCDTETQTCKVKPLEACSTTDDCCSPNTCQYGYCRPPIRCARTFGQSCSVTSKTNCCKSGTCQGGKCCVPTNTNGCTKDSDCCSYGDTCDKTSGICKKKSPPVSQCTAGLGKRCRPTVNLKRSGISSSLSCCKIGTCGLSGTCCLASGVQGCNVASDCCAKTDECSSGTCKPKPVACSVNVAGSCDTTTPGKCCKGDLTCSPTNSKCCVKSTKTGCTLSTDCCDANDECSSGTCTPKPVACSVDVAGSCDTITPGKCCKGALTCSPTNSKCCVESTKSGCTLSTDCCDANDECSSGTCTPKPVACSVEVAGTCDTTTPGKCCKGDLTCSPTNSKCCVESTKAGCTVATDCCDSKDTCVMGTCTPPPVCSAQLLGTCTAGSEPCCVEGLTCGPKNQCCLGSGSTGCTAAGDCCKSDDICLSGSSTCGACIATGAGTCAADSDCCGQASDNIVCLGDKTCGKKPCVGEGASCKNDCCLDPYTCQNDICKPKPPTCTGSALCCNSFTTASDRSASLILGILGIVVQDGNTKVGLTCSPRSTTGGCSAQSLCCQNNAFNGLIAIDCVQLNPININL